MEELKVGDIVVLNGMDGKVKEGFRGFFVEHGEDRSNKKLLEMGQEKARQISLEVLGYEGEGDFPACLTLSHLTRFVGALLEWESKQKLQVAEGKMLTWKSSMAKVLWSKFVGKQYMDVEELFMEGSPLENRLKESELIELLTEEAIAITIGGLGYYIRKSDADKLNPITNP